MKNQGIYDHGSNGREVADRALLRMSLSSTASAGLMDLGDLQNVWNRKDNLSDLDADIARQIKAKYEMNKWLTYLDIELEDEFMEKYFHNAVKAHRKFFVLIVVIFLAFLGLMFTDVGFNLAYVVIDLFCVFVAILGYYATTRPNFRDYHLKMMGAIVVTEMAGVGATRFFADMEEDLPSYLSPADARYFHIMEFFAYYCIFMSMRFPFKIACKIFAVVALMYIVKIACFPIITYLDMIENILIMAIVVGPIASAGYANELRYRNQDARRAGILKHTEEVVKEKGITEKLLLNILPNQIAKRLMEGEEVISDGYGQVTVLFADLVGWTDIARSMSPVDSIQLLGDIVSTFDRIAHIHKVEKIKTIGDAYLVACGLPVAMPAVESARTMANFALDMMRGVDGLSKQKGVAIQLTLGLHTGPVVAGVIGKTKFLYDLWGDSVNTASRMQSHGEPGRIHTTSEFFGLLEHEYEFEKRAAMEVKGKGIMQTYYLVGRKTSVGGAVGSIQTANGLVVEEVGAAGTGQETKDENVVAKYGEAKQIVDGEKDKGEEGDGSQDRKERKRQRAKEALMKKTKEVDEMLEKQVQSKRGILSFVKSEHEEQFRQNQERLCQDRSEVFLWYIVGIQVFSGPDVLLFDGDADKIQTYYMVMGPCIGLCIVLGVMCRVLKQQAHKYVYWAVFVLHLSLLVLFGVYRSEGTKAARYCYFFLMIYSIIVFMASQLPYRQTMKLLYGSFFLFVLECIMVNSAIGLDTTSLAMYFFIVLFGQVTAKEIEKHARFEFLLSLLADEERARVTRQREESERLLHNILPESVITKMREGGGKLIDTYGNASVLFADVVGFTVLSSKLDARSIVTMLNQLFSQFDTLGEQLGMEKIKTIGDAYMAVCGLPYPRPDHAEVAVRMGLGMIKIVQALPDIEGLRVNMRIGVHSGSVVGGLVGLSKMVFDIWGENVNIASKMESYGSPGRVDVSHVTKELIGEGHGLLFEDRSKTVHIGGNEFRLFFVSEDTESAPMVSSGLPRNDW
eukprot:TRINITY_DN155_c0_g1_i3.p1 TRINITY_DN155_c0_g1~~TRINITY_DN155_c0_g1_i3.p1  ORF type:complete len:1020 (+),score=231.86 TRINITY_DN155_c0_g1_i3:52-3111(+)